MNLEVQLLESCHRLVSGADDKNYYNNRCTVELDDVEEIEELLRIIDKIQINGTY